MKSGWMKKTIALMAVVTLFSGVIAGCNTHTYEETEPSLLISAEELAALDDTQDIRVVDMQEPEAYAQEHLEGAVNIPTADIVINVPVKNLLTSKKKIETIMGENGISNDTLVIAYDTDKMGASRLLWTLFMYGFENVKVVNGGLDAIKAAGLTMTKEAPSVTPATFTAGEVSEQWGVDMERVRKQVDYPEEGVVLLDTRSEEEFNTDGHIPGSVLRDYTENFYEDGTFKVKEITRIEYKESKINPEDEIIIYCKTSFRAAPVFVQLYEAGYRNIKLYDGAFLEWSSQADNPVERPEGAAAPVEKDVS